MHFWPATTTPSKRWDAARSMLWVAVVLSVAAYWPGLSGPFLFDDTANLSIFRWWYNGQVDWRMAVFGRSDLITARPVSMASFLATTWAAGPGPLSYKLGNLALHVGCAWTAFSLLRRSLDQDARLAHHARLLAAAAVALWLLHPLHVSTVLYAVQRMAQLAALFVLGSLAVYLAARILLREGKAKLGAALLFVAFPLLVSAGVLSKQNAIVAPALCAVLELAYFSQAARPRIVLLFFAVFLALPLALASALLASHSGALLSGYAEWDFTPSQRLLTQPRALADYVGLLLIPRGQRMSLFTDDFVVSQGLLSPPTTLLALLALTALSLAAIAVRKHAPSVFAGWFFFLVAHSVESTILPLEMYYEHRNYLPSFGIALGVVGACALWPTPRLSQPGNWRIAAFAAVSMVCIGLAASTYARSTIWQSKDAIVANALTYHHDSLRARQTQSLMAMNEGRYDDSAAIMRKIALSPDPRRRTLARLDLLSIACFAGQNPAPERLELAIAERRPSITLDEVLVMDLLVQATGQGRCPRISDDLLGTAIGRLLSSASAQSDSAAPKAQMSFLAALLYARSGHWLLAQQHAERAWTPRAAPEVGDLLVRACLHNGQRAKAEAALTEIRRRTPAYDRQGQARITALRAAIDAS